MDNILDNSATVLLKSLPHTHKPNKAYNIAPGQVTIGSLHFAVGGIWDKVKLCRHLQSAHCIMPIYLQFTDSPPNVGWNAEWQWSPLCLIAELAPVSVHSNGRSVRGGPQSTPAEHFRNKRKCKKTIKHQKTKNHKQSKGNTKRGNTR